MARHITYRGVAIDMDSLVRENEKVPAIGNMQVNAKGDQISGGVVTKSADQIARENHRVKSAVVSSGLKGKPPVAPSPVFETPKAQVPEVPKKQVKTAERELPSGDIVIGDDNENS